MDHSELFQQISSQVVERYSLRFSSLGINVKSLGWGTSEQQKSRFINLNRVINFDNQSVVDIGCGFGDLFGFLQSEQIPFLSYTGLDINPNFIAVSNERYFSNPLSNFSVKDILLEKPVEPMADIGVMLGLLNYNYNNSSLNEDFTRHMISNAFEAVRSCLYVDFLSIHRHLGYPKEDFIFYHDPAMILNYALSLTSSVSLLHEFDPIPQKEFSLIMYK